jgi:hypothetical protein
MPYSGSWVHASPAHRRPCISADNCAGDTSWLQVVELLICGGYRCPWRYQAQGRAFSQAPDSFPEGGKNSSLSGQGVGVCEEGCVYLFQNGGFPRHARWRLQSSGSTTSPLISNQDESASRVGFGMLGKASVNSFATCDLVSLNGLFSVWTHEISLKSNI